MRATKNQSFFDIAAMSTGTIESAFDIAAAAGKSLSDEPAPGVEYAVPDGVAMQKEVMKYIADNKVEIGTQETETTIGLGVLSLGSVFKI